MNKNKIIFWISTGLLSLMILGAAIGKYIMSHEEMVGVFEGHLGFPAWLIYPMAIAKISGISAIIFRKFKLVTGLAYAGFFFNFLLAIGAHLAVGDGFEGVAGGLMALVLLTVSYFFGEKAFSEE
jgi:hypothetical protein